MRLAIIIIFLSFFSRALGQAQTGKFSVSFSTFNHAERIYDGTTTYILTDSSIKVLKTGFLEKTSKTVYAKKIKNNQPLIAALRRMELDTLQEHYFNYCIMIASGNEYFLDIAIDSTNKSIWLHHYYLNLLEEIIQLLNSNLPKKYRFDYLPEDLKQDCSPPGFDTDRNKVQ